MQPADANPKKSFNVGAGGGGGDRELNIHVNLPSSDSPAKIPFRGYGGSPPAILRSQLTGRKKTGEIEGKKSSIANHRREIDPTPTPPSGAARRYNHHGTDDFVNNGAIHITLSIF